MMSFSAPASYENMNGNCVCVCVRWIKGCMMFVFLPLFLDHNGSVKWIYCVLCVLVSLDWLHKTPNNDTISSTRQIPWKLKVPTVLMHKISHHFYRFILFFCWQCQIVWTKLFQYRPVFFQQCLGWTQCFFSLVIVVCNIVHFESLSFPEKPNYIWWYGVTHCQQYNREKGQVRLGLARFGSVRLGSV